jgi:hypothetical protein
MRIVAGNWQVAVIRGFVTKSGGQVANHRYVTSRQLDKLLPRAE